MGLSPVMLLLAALLVGAALGTWAQEFTYKNSGSDWPTLCQTGQTQSPLNIVRKSVVQAGANPEFRFSYSNLTDMQVFHNPQLSVVEVIPGNSTPGFFFPYGPSQRYQLLQFHFHAPGEHTIDGAFGAAEAHYVHRNVSGGNSSLAVWAVLFALHPENVANPWLDTFLPLVPLASRSVQQVTLCQPFDPSAVFASSPLDYYTYPGSLTTPPCNETVTWFIAQTWQWMSAEQLKRMFDLNEAVTGERTNERLVQPARGRQIRAFSVPKGASPSPAPAPSPSQPAQSPPTQY